MNNQILQFVQQALQQGKDPQEIMQMLVQQGVPEEQAMQILQQVSQPQMQKGGQIGDVESFMKTYNSYKKIDFAKQPILVRDLDPGWRLPSNPNWKDLDPGFSQMHTTQPVKLPNGNVVYPTFKKITPGFSRVQNSNFQKGGKFREHGYDAIHPSMYAQMQKLADEMYLPHYPSQEETSQMLAELPLKEVTWITDQRRKLAKKALPANVYNYAQQHLMQTPQLRRLVNPQTVLANQTYQDGGMTDAEAKVFYKNPRYVQSVVDAEQNSFIGPPNYPVTEMPVVNDADYGYDDSPVFVDPESMASVTSRQQSVPAFVSKPRVLKKQMSKADLMRKSNKEYANVTDQRMKSMKPVYNLPSGVNKSTQPQLENKNQFVVHNPIQKTNSSSNIGRNIAIGATGAAALGAGTIGYMGYYHPDVLRKYAPVVYNNLPNHSDVVKQVNKQVKNLNNKINNLQKIQYPTMNLPKINLNNIPERVGTTLYQYPRLKPMINSADKSYRQLERLSKKTLKRLFR